MDVILSKAPATLELVMVSSVFIVILSIPIDIVRKTLIRLLKIR